MSILLTLPFFKIFHIFISITFLIISLWLYISIIDGLLKKRLYNKTDKILSYAFIVSLYLQLIFGLVLFSNLSSESGISYINADNTIKLVSKRLWPIEHIVMMIFAVFIANLGLIISLNTNSSKKKSINILIYYSISILLIFYSLSAIYFF